MIEHGPCRHDPEQLAQESRHLRKRLLRAAKDLVAIEDRRAACLLEQTKAAPEDRQRLLEEAAQARMNGDRATTFVVDLECT